MNKIEKLAQEHAKIARLCRCDYNTGSFKVGYQKGATEFAEWIDDNLFVNTQHGWHTSLTATYGNDYHTIEQLYEIFLNEE